MNTYFKVLVIADKSKDHVAMSHGSTPFFTGLASDNGFGLDFTDDAATVTTASLAAYKVVVVLNLAPFDIPPAQQQALEQFVKNGNGWVGIHAAGLTGKQFVGSDTPYWQWFEDLLGGVTYVPHPAYQTGTVIVEDRSHPATCNLPERFSLSDEWYEFSHSPRGRVRVLATADESTYRPNKPMGDHPVIWTNENYRRAIYIALGHDTTALESSAYITLLRDAILWAAS